MQWCGSMLCLYKLRSGVAACYVFINYAMVWQHAMSLYTMQWCGSILCLYKLYNGVAACYVFINYAMMWQHAMSL